MATIPYDDPLSVESAPSLSFRDAAVGTMYRGTIVRRPELVQSRDFESGLPKTWPDGNPVMSVVIVLDVQGEERSIWAQKPSAMFRALVEAQKEAGGKPMAEGGILDVKFVGEEPNKKNPKLNAQKLYKARYTPPTPTDAFADTPATPPAPARRPAPAAPAPASATQW
jgi:hypothetical protein